MDERPRVLVVGFTVVPASSADSTALLHTARALSTTCEVDLVTVKTDSLPHLEQIGRARILRVPLGPGSRPERGRAFRRALQRQLEGEPYDVVHVRGALEGLVAVERRRQSPFRLVYEIATFPTEDEGGARAERAWLQAHRICAAAADVVLVASPAARAAIQRGGTAPRWVVVVPPGVDIDRFDWEPAPTGPLKRVLYLGSYAHDRDVPTLLEAARRVARRDDVRWLLAGDADAGRRTRMRELVANFGLGDVVDVRGEPDPDALPLVIASADICVVPAAPTPRFEDHGDVPEPLLEHMACRRPVIVARVPGIEPIVRHEVEGLHYDPGDDEDLAAQVALLCDDGELRHALAEAAYRRVRDDFNSSARRRKLAAIYQQLLDLPADGQSWWSTGETGSTLASGTGPGGDAASGARTIHSESTLIVLQTAEPSSPALATPPDTDPGASAGERGHPTSPGSTEDATAEHVLPEAAPRGRDPSDPVDTHELSLPDDAEPD